MRNLLLAAALSLFAFPASAAMMLNIQHFCDTPDGLAKALPEYINKDSKPVSNAIVDTESGLKATIVVNPEGKWAFIVARPDGLSCIIAIGDSINTTEYTYKPSQGS